MPDDTPTTDDEYDEIESVTTSTQTRWTYLGSLLASITVITFLVMVGAGVFGFATLSTVPSSWFYVLTLLVLTAGGWTFGTDLVEAYRDK